MQRVFAELRPDDANFNCCIHPGRPRSTFPRPPAREDDLGTDEVGHRSDPGCRRVPGPRRMVRFARRCLRLTQTRESLLTPTPLQAAVCSFPSQWAAGPGGTRADRRCWQRCSYTGSNGRSETDRFNGHISLTSRMRRTTTHSHPSVLS